MSVQDVQSEAESSGTTAAPGTQTRVLHLIGTFAQGGSERQAVRLTGVRKQSGRFGVELAVLDPEGILREEAKRWGFSEVPTFPLTSFYDWNMGVQLRRCAAIKFALSITAWICAESLLCQREGAARSRSNLGCRRMETCNS